MPLFDKNMRKRIGDSQSLIRLNKAYSGGTLNGAGVNRPVGSNGASRKVRGNGIFNDYRNIPFDNMPAPARTENPRETIAYVGGEKMVMGRVNSPEMDLGFAAPYPGGRGVGRGTGLSGAAEEELFRTRLHSLTKQLKAFIDLPLVGTSAATEKSVYEGFRSLVKYGEENLSGVYAQAPAAIKGELGRWADDRAKTIQGGATNQFGLGKIKDRMLTAVNRARVIMGLAPVNVPGGTLTQQLTSMIPHRPANKKPTAPVPTASAPTPMKAEFPTKTVLLVGAALIAAGTAYYYLKK